MQECWEKNFWVTIAGVMGDAAFAHTLNSVGEDRLMWSVDYPYEDYDENANGLTSWSRATTVEQTLVGRMLKDCLNRPPTENGIRMSAPPNHSSFMCQYTDLSF